MDEAFFIYFMFSTFVAGTTDLCCFRDNDKPKKMKKTMIHVAEPAVTMDPYVTGPELTVSRVKYTNHPSSRDSYMFPVFHACLRCAICIAIAEKLNETLISAHAGLRGKKMSNVTELMRSSCNNGFKNFALREALEHHILTDIYEPTNHISSCMDGKWAEKLRNVCHFYLNEFDEEELYREWASGELFSPHDMVNIICRSNGVFRDCWQIEDTVISTTGNKCCERDCKKYQFRVACPLG